MNYVGGRFGSRDELIQYALNGMKSRGTHVFLMHLRRGEGEGELELEREDIVLRRSEEVRRN